MDFAGKLRIEVLKKCLDKKFFFKIISCGLIDLQEFKEEQEANNEDRDEFEME